MYAEAAVESSRSTPNRHVSFGEHGESDPDLHLENESSSEAVRDWFPGSCIQLASIDLSRAGAGSFYKAPGARP